MAQPTKLEKDLPDFISLAEAAKLLAVSERMITRWVKAGKLRAFHLKNITRISRQDFIIFINTNTVNAEDEDGHEF